MGLVSVLLSNWVASWRAVRGWDCALEPERFWPRPCPDLVPLLTADCRDNPVSSRSGLVSDSDRSLILTFFQHFL